LQLESSDLQYLIKEIESMNNKCSNNDDNEINDMEITKYAESNNPSTLDICPFNIMPIKQSYDQIYSPLQKILSTHISDNTITLRNSSINMSPMTELLKKTNKISILY
jgi:hypothetical protein